MAHPDAKAPGVDRVHKLIRRAVDHPDFATRLAKMASGADELVLEHACEPSHAFYCAAICLAAREQKRGKVWLLSELPRHRERLAAELELWGITAHVMPDAPTETSEGTIADPESAADWFAVLEALARDAQAVVLCDPEAFDQAAPDPKALRASRRSLEPGMELDPEQLAISLSEHAYQRVPTVAQRGEFAVRGGIIDLFTWQGSRPLRLEFFDTEVESIREFDPDSQTSTRRLAQTDLLLEEPEAAATLESYRHENDVVVAIEDDTFEPADARLLTGSLPGEEEDFTLASHEHPVGRFEAGDFVLEEKRREQFLQQLDEWRGEGWTIGMVFSNRGEEERFAELAGKPLPELGLTPLRGELMAGYTIPDLKLAMLSSQELFGRYRNPGASPRRSAAEQARAARVRANVEEMEEGDLVVHYEYGLARFCGVHPGEDGDELQLEYRDGAMLGVPIEQAHLVGKYVGLGGRKPQLSKLGSVAWKNARKSAEKSILDYAAQLLRVQAEREHEPGYAHPPDSQWMWEFERSFHYTETTDQRRAIEETKHDLEQEQPMDRLICGDVGFGKTEVAIRAAFKAVSGGKQVAILVPTTVLAEQHWRTLRERMSDYPFHIRLLNRFRSRGEIRETIEGLADGSVDIVIGTHRLISGDVAFKNLGLVVIDEEQRFGVAHKEKFKQLFRQIDVLTLSATPIPRTLYMALMGARDMSTIETPPPNRVPVSTTICAYDERIIREAIRKEMKRGGQVFFLHNRVKSIEMMAGKLRDLVPEARIVVGHGQMDKSELEVVMHHFVEGKADVLLATTIIETGIDIPNANTILIDRADRFGLADLYQLRGRVGRAGQKAHAYLLLPRDMMTRGDARKRIHAIKQYTALGSGFKIAMRDLEIRGAGNLLGTKQSGHIAQIGFELYCQLLRQSVERLKGGAKASLRECTFKADFLAATETAWLKRVDEDDVLPAYLPSSWLEETSLRIAAYKEWSEARNLKAVEALAKTWRDRFGRLPDPVENLLTISRIKAMAASRGIDEVEIIQQRLMLHRGGDYILMEGRRFPKLKAIKPAAKLDETLAMLREM
ncbi:MAG: transcription-repair coupling factor [Akkermansiaceae bacterium]|nr:transcription-repair coupling factor [Akkermansiaceae bacterium]